LKLMLFMTENIGLGRLSGVCTGGALVTVIDPGSARSVTFFGCCSGGLDAGVGVVAAFCFTGGLGSDSVVIAPDCVGDVVGVDV
jgi:hypothetical protein